MTKPPRLAVITAKTVRVFEGRKFLAEYLVQGELSAEDIEAARTSDNPLALTKGDQS